MDVQISKTHQTSYRGIFQHPAARNLQWHDVRSMESAIVYRAAPSHSNSAAIRKFVTCPFRAMG